MSNNGIEKRVRSVFPLATAIAVFLFASCGITSTIAVVDVNVGDETTENAAPNFQLTLFETANHTKGEHLALSDLSGSPVVLNFWFPSCPPCRAEMPDFEASFQSHKGEVAFVGIQQLGLDSVQEGQDFINEIGLTFAVGPDESNIVSRYQIIGFPSTIFLNQDLNIEKKWTGALNREKLEELIQELLQ